MKKYLKISIVIIVIISCIYLLLLIIRKSKEKTKLAESKNTESKNNFSIGCSYNDKEFPLRKCKSGGSNVEDLQKVINDIFFKVNPTNTLSVDGKYGSKTERAVKSLIGKKEISKNELEALRSDSKDTNKVMSVYYPLVSEEYNLPGYHTVSEEVQELME